MIKKLWKSELGRGTIVLFVTINIYNFLNLIFHFSMGRILGPADYGTLAALMSIVYIYGIPTEAIQNIISNYTSKFNVKKEKGKTKFLMLRSLKKGFKMSLLIFAVLIIPSWFLSLFLNINFLLILITNLIIFSSFSVPIMRGILQGRKKFSFLGTSMAIESIVKVVVAVLLVIAGMKVLGAIAGVLVGFIIGFFAAVYFNNDVFRAPVKKISFKGIYPKSIPYFVSMLVVLVMLSIDIILAKRFFSPELAGQYSVLSMLGKMIFFGTVAVSKAMFPLTSEKHYNKESSSELFKKSIFIISSMCAVSISVFFLFPELVIKILYGRNYTFVAPYLGYSGIALSFLSLSNLILIYRLSINKLKRTTYLLMFLIIELILLFIFHKTIKEYILSVMISNMLLFIGSFLTIKSKEN